ncbi:MAG: hypothetical protein HY660_01515 [Armatimonadetes bacterium]|nr:hypothetical protein [Armatimonadota bacterium]
MRWRRVAFLLLLFGGGFVLGAFDPVPGGAAFLGAPARTSGHATFAHHNAYGDLIGWRRDDAVVLWWDRDQFAGHYRLLRAPGPGGPWEPVLHMTAEDAEEHVAILDRPLRVVGTCYRVEAFDSHDELLRTYVPLCITSDHLGPLLRP